MLAGEKTYAFTAIKLRLEFDWMRICTVGWGKKAKKNASKMRQEGDVYDFESWVADGRQMRMKEWRNGGYQAIQASSGCAGSADEMECEESPRGRRAPVLDRDGAAREVLKYITKVADFSDLPEAIEVFCDAVRGARLIQTFGTWYGVKLDTVFDPEHMDDWGEMKCALRAQLLGTYGRVL